MTMCRVRRPVVAFVLAIDGASFAAAANEIFKTKKKGNKLMDWMTG
jgi:hypothetical protein